jgi:hypothetical protein
MRFLSISDEKDQYLIEINEKGFATRQIVFSEDGTCHISCREDCLAEGQIKDSDMDGEVKEISEQEFESDWNDIVSRYRYEWEAIKLKNHIDDVITGDFKCYYPQGKIFTYNQFFVLYKGRKEAKLHTEIEMRIIGFDNKNMWIVADD